LLSENRRKRGEGEEEERRERGGREEGERRERGGRGGRGGERKEPITIMVAKGREKRDDLV
jgi:hypothetical protein